MSKFLRKYVAVNMLFLLLLPALSYTQNLSEIIEMHKDNLRNLYATRGLPPGWVTEGDVHLSDIVDKLRLYRKRVGTIIYTLVNDSLNVVLLTRDGIVFHRTTEITPDSLEHAVTRVNRYFSQPVLSNQKRGASVLAQGKDGDDIQKTLAFINDLLLPDKELISGLDHLVVVPVLNIASIPFYALKLDDKRYLVDQMSYSIAPSLYETMVSQQINFDRAESVGADLKYEFQKALIVADPDFSGGTGPALPELPGTREEASQVRKKLGADHTLYLQGIEATHEKVVSGICDYDMLYFATHGIADAGNPLDSSYLALAHGERLTAREIQGIRRKCMLHADLVILSACQTGLGGSHLGGTIGMARAFQIAGANHVLTSLWNIDDLETGVLMARFFDELKKGGELMPHEALRRAVLDYRNTSSKDPYFWAPFSIFGLPY